MYMNAVFVLLLLFLLILLLISINTQHFGYSRIATNCTHLVVEFVSNIDGKVRDTLVLENTDRCLEAHNVRKESFSMAGVLSTAVQLLSNLGHYIF